MAIHKRKTIKNYLVSIHIQKYHFFQGVSFASLRPGFPLYLFIIVCLYFPLEGDYGGVSISQSIIKRMPLLSLTRHSASEKTG